MHSNRGQDRRLPVATPRRNFVQLSRGGHFRQFHSVARCRTWTLVRSRRSQSLRLSRECTVCQLRFNRRDVHIIKCVTIIFLYGITAKVSSSHQINFVEPALVSTIKYKRLFLDVGINCSSFSDPDSDVSRSCLFGSRDPTSLSAEENCTYTYVDIVCT